ncbi:MAG: hypothetical protein M1816_004701 [Peltula sp. TS41687]|nr:MAG: hypothetical protein M1816_004701 [Peltula sp. TS41687]
MASPKMRTVEEVLNFTVKDVQGLGTVHVNNWPDLPEETRNECIMKLRDLVRQRDEMAQSDAVDANQLEERLRQISSSSTSRSQTPLLPDYSIDPVAIEEDLKLEREAYKALIDDHGRPSHPIELGFDVRDNPGSYKDIISYWRDTSSSIRLFLLAQLNRWKKFRQFQQRVRRYYVQRNRFPEYRQKVLERRRRHGLDNDVELLEDIDKQSELVNWMEYQDYELQSCESYEKDVKKAQATLESSQKALAEAGLPGWEGVYEPDNFGNNYALCVQSGREESKARNRRELAEGELQLAEKRLKAAQSDCFGETVERAAWIRLAQEEVKAARMRLDQLQHLAEIAQRDLDPFNEWWYAKQIEFGRRRRKGLTECEWEAPGLTVESAKLIRKEFDDQMEQYHEHCQKAHDASTQRFRAQRALERAERESNAAQLDDFGETVEKVTLVRLIQKEVESEQKRVDEARKLETEVKLRGKVLGALCGLANTTRKLKQHKILLEWIERERQQITTECADTEKEGNQDQDRRARQGALQNHTATGASRPNRSSKGSGRKWKLSTEKSALSPTDPSRVFKAPRKKASPHRMMSLSHDTIRAAETATTDPGVPESRSKQTSKAKDVVPTSLRPIHSSRVSKSGDTRPTGLRRDDTKLPPATNGRWRTLQKTLDMSSAAWTGRKAKQPSVRADTSLRRSTRISKKPERFRPG